MDGINLLLIASIVRATQKSEPLPEKLGVKIPSSRDHDEFRSDQSMTPMIDVVFLLLIFFVCASVGQIKESFLPTELSAGSIAAAQAPQPAPPLGEAWLHIQRKPAGNTTVELNGQEYADFVQLRKTLEDLASAAPEIPVILEIDSNVTLENMIRVYDICRGAGFESINFAADAEKLTKKPASSP